MKEMLMMLMNGAASFYNEASAKLVEGWNALVPTAKYVYGVYVRQTVTVGVTELLAILLHVGLFYVLYRVWWKVNPFRLKCCYSNNDPLNGTYDWDEAPNVFAAIFWVAGGAILTAAFTCCACDWISTVPLLVQYVINPEYFVIENLSGKAINLLPK